MCILGKYSADKLLLISFICSLLIVYPNITWLPWEISMLADNKKIYYLLFFILRCILYTIFIFALIKINVRKIQTTSFQSRLLYNSLIILFAFCIYVGVFFILKVKIAHLGSLVLFQFFLICILCTLSSYIYQLYNEKKNKELEIEQLKIENLQSQYNALIYQVNPHFFFNSLNGLVSLIRKKDDLVTLTYVNKLSDVFRYILQSDKKGLVTFREELDFIQAFRYMMEVRFANKLIYDIKINQSALSYKLPVLSVMPILDNIVVHNIIDSDHKMIITIEVNECKELVVSNPIYPKIFSPTTNGTGLNNLKNRFSLLTNGQIKIKNDGVTFTVYLPLI